MIFGFSNKVTNCSNCGSWDLERTMLPWIYRKLSGIINFRAKKCRKCFNIDVYIKDRKWSQPQ
jgi:hypothetical protein